MSQVALQAERAFRAMGSDAHVIVWCPNSCPIAPEDLLDVAESEIARLEGLWSRFRPDSDISRLNAAGGRPVVVADETAALLDLCVVASQRTAGRFDPMVLPDLLDAGYVGSFETLRSSDEPIRWGDSARRARGRSRRRAAPASPEPAQGRVRTGGGGVDGSGSGPATRPSVAADLALDPVAGTARLGVGAAIDVGGIGKGRAADLVAGTLARLGAEAACVNLGGDLRSVGEVPGGTGVLVAIEDPFGGADLALWSVHDGAVATSSQLRRRWTVDGEERHHLIDPRTGRPAVTDVVACSVAAPTGAWADVLAKSVLLAPADEAEELLAPMGAAALVVRAGGLVSTVGSLPNASSGAEVETVP